MITGGSPRAKERYLTLLEENPELLQYVPLKHIASYLWITPQSLSRIRAELGRRKKTNDNFSIYGVGSFVWKRIVLFAFLVWFIFALMDGRKLASDKYLS